MKMQELTNEIIKFRDARDWDIFHDPKNLAEAISIEAAELQEIFLWKTVEESRKIAIEKRERIGEELASIFSFWACLGTQSGNRY